MSNVASVKQNPKKPENAYIKFDDGTEAWCPSFEKASALELGKPLPDGWTQDQGEYGPRAFPPKDRKGFAGGKSSWYNSEEGTRFTQERMDRRTALMQAVVVLGAAQGDPLTLRRPADWLDTATEMYAWLRKSAGSAHPSGSAADTGSPTPLSGEPEHSAGIQGRSAEETGGAAVRAAEGEAAKTRTAAPTCPACNSPNIGRKGRTWRCGEEGCKQEWSA